MSVRHFQCPTCHSVTTLGECSQKHLKFLNFPKELILGESGRSYFCPFCNRRVKHAKEWR